jgi:ABC-type lipoprotein release transport system permease subunit
MGAWQLAWRNLQRNRARTWISIIALTVTTAVVIVLQGLSYGMNDLVMHGAVDLGVGEVQAHAKAYALDQSLYETLPTADAVIAAAKANGIDAAPRAIGAAFLAHADKSSGALVWGVDPGAERALGDLPRHLRAGTFLPDNPDDRILLGSELARILGVTVGDKIAFIVQATDGSTSTELMTLNGIFESAGDIDVTLAMMDRRDFEKLFLLMGGKVHEVALSSHARLPAERVAALVTPAAGDTADVKTWRELLPTIGEFMDLVEGGAALLFAVFFAAATLGLLNTMLMATTERIREFGILKALGAGPWRIVGDVTREAVVLGALGAGLGGLAGGAGTWWLARHGINLSIFGNISFAGVGLDPSWHAHETVAGAGACLLGMMVATLLAALYPAITAARLVPVDAINHV